MYVLLSTEQLAEHDAGTYPFCFVCFLYGDGDIRVSDATHVYQAFSGWHLLWEHSFYAQLLRTIPRDHKWCRSLTVIHMKVTNNQIPHGKQVSNVFYLSNRIRNDGHTFVVCLVYFRYHTIRDLSQREKLSPHCTSRLCVYHHVV